MVIEQISFLMFARLLDIREIREEKKRQKGQESRSGGSIPIQHRMFTGFDFDVVLANPPFKGSLDYEHVHAYLLSKDKTKKTELLFITLILRMLKMGGRSATVVPDGVLFGSSKAHVALRKMPVADNQLEAVIFLPAGVFRPYAGVSTGIIVFTKGGQTRDVFYYDVQADGYSMDDRRTKIDNNDLPDLLKRWKNRNPKRDTVRTGKAFFVPVKEIRDNKYDLSSSISRRTKTHRRHPRQSRHHLPQTPSGDPTRQ